MKNKPKKETWETSTWTRADRIGKDKKENWEELENLIKIIRFRMDKLWGEGLKENGNYLVKCKEYTEEDIKHFIKQATDEAYEKGKLDHAILNAKIMERYKNNYEKNKQAKIK